MSVCVCVCCKPLCSIGAGIHLYIMNQKHISS